MKIVTENKSVSAGTLAQLGQDYTQTFYKTIQDGCIVVIVLIFFLQNNGKFKISPRKKEDYWKLSFTMWKE